MLDEPYLKREIEFDRERLGALLPNRLRELLQAIDDARDRMEDWYASLFIKIGNSVIRICLDLAQTIDQDEALPAAAWNARNLLELWIWIKYCSKSQASARRFHEDALRDALGLVEAHSSMCKIAGIQNESEDIARQTLAEIARKELWTEPVDTDYERVSDAAKHVGLGDAFKAWNTHLSKFAHPTAGLVVGLMHQSELVRHIQSGCTTVGLYYCGQCVVVFETIVSAIPRKS
jgi:hypothetical protein